MKGECWTPHLIFLEVPLTGIFGRFLGSQKAGHCARRSLWRPWKLGLRIVAWLKPRMFCEESLGKIKFRAFPKRVGLRILSLESVDYFGASEHYWVVEKKKERRILISKIAMIRCCKLSLYANESCDEHAIYLISARIEMTSCKSSVWFTLGSEDETMFWDTWNLFQLDCRSRFSKHSIAGGPIFSVNFTKSSTR